MPSSRAAPDTSAAGYRSRHHQQLRRRSSFLPRPTGAHAGCKRRAATGSWLMANTSESPRCRPSVTDGRQIAGDAIGHPADAPGHCRMAFRQPRGYAGQRRHRVGLRVIQTQLIRFSSSRQPSYRTVPFVYTPGQTVHRLRLGILLIAASANQPVSSKPVSFPPQAPDETSAMLHHRTGQSLRFASSRTLQINAERGAHANTRSSRRQFRRLSDTAGYPRRGSGTSGLGMKRTQAPANARPEPRRRSHAGQPWHRPAIAPPDFASRRWKIRFRKYPSLIFSVRFLFSGFQ